MSSSENVLFVRIEMSFTIFYYRLKLSLLTLSSSNQMLLYLCVHFRRSILSSTISVEIL